MNKKISLEVIVDGTGAAFAVDHRRDRIGYTQAVMATDLELRYDAVRLLVPRVFATEESQSVPDPVPWKALKSLEMATRTMLIAVPRERASTAEWQADQRHYEALVRSNLDWALCPIYFDETSPPTGSAQMAAALHALQSAWDEASAVRDAHGADPLRAALTATVPAESTRSALHEAAQRAYAGRDYGQKRFASFIEYVAGSSPLRTMQAAADLHRDSLDGGQLAARIEEAIRKAQPFSFVRIGEGEGCFLSYAKYLARRDAVNEVFGVCAKDIYRIWFDKNIHEADTADLERIRSLFWDAMKSADVIGVPTPERVVYEYAHFISDMEKHGYSRGYVGVAEILNHLAQARTDGRLGKSQVADCDVARPLYGWQDWSTALACTLPRLLKGAHEVTLVTCHDALAPALQRLLGIHRVRTLLIPPERGRVKGEGLLAGDHFADHFQRVTEELRRDPGAVVLVGAGFLGKSYCATAKTAGSVAVDIGSLADYWVGVNTRAKNAWSIPSPFHMKVQAKVTQ